MPAQDVERYAIYYAPPAGSELARRGAAWLGWDAEAAIEPTPDAPEALAGMREALTRRPRRYGFHATLKAPFRLNEGFGRPMIEEAVAAFAARTPAVSGPGLEVAADLGFVALRPSGPAPAVDALAAACVRELDLLRAPLAQAELARRRRGGLDMVEEAHLRDWGYPFVLDRFRFHMTLTGPLSERDSRTAAEALGLYFADALEPDLVIDEIALFGDPGGGAPFRLLRRFPLGG